jgi:FixJ family two-component response regulator
MSEQSSLVYLVHCDSDVLLSLYEILSAAGFEVAASSNALDALKYVRRTKPRAVLCHWEMPEMGGAEFLECSRRRSPETRIIMTSQHADGPMYDEVRGQGGDDVLREPLSGVAVVHVVSRMLGFSVPYPSTDQVNYYSMGSGVGEGRQRRSS